MYNDSLTRLNKYISESGMCSRRDADRYIEQGNVFINGKRAGVGDRVGPKDQVKVNGQLIEAPAAEDFIFIALNSNFEVWILIVNQRSTNICCSRYSSHAHFS